MNVRRRTLLRAIGAGALTLPLLPERRSRAGEGATPRRLVVVHFAHGVARDRWSPSVGEGSGALELSEILQQRHFFEFKAQCYSLTLELRESNFRNNRFPDLDLSDRDFRFSFTLKNVGTFIDLSGGISD